MMNIGGLRTLGDLATRLGLGAKMGSTHQGDRDLYQSFGYTVDPDFDRYLSYYTRGDIAARIVDIEPQATWRHAPQITVDGDAEHEFVKTFVEMESRLRLFHFMQRVDEISGIGQFGILLIGTRGTQITEEPGSLNGPEDLVYVRAYHQGSVKIQSYVEDTESERYGLPAVYSIKLAGTTNSVTGKTEQQREIKVPWQRVVHVAEGCIEGEVFGEPRLARVLNRVDDLQKLLGSSAELFWQNIGGIWHADIDPDVNVTETDQADFEDQITAARQGINRLIQTRGVELQSISGAPVDPTGVYAALKQIICAARGVPERVLFGSERGQLAGDQDQAEWHGQVASRQERHAEPNILRAVVGRFVDLGALKLPPEGFDVKWPPQDVQTTDDIATTAQKFADAISKASPGGAADLIMPPWEFREVVLGLDAVPPEPPEGFEIVEEEEEPPPPPVVPADV